MLSCSFSLFPHGLGLFNVQKEGKPREKEKEGQEHSYQVRKTIQLLAHQAALLAPARDLAIEKVEKEAKGQECEGAVEVAEGGRIAKEVAHRGEDGHDAAEAIELRDEVGQVQGADEREVADLG